MREKTVKTSFNITVRHSKSLKHDAEKYQISPSEMLRRILDAHWDMPYAEVYRGIPKGTKLKKKEWVRNPTKPRQESERRAGCQ